MKIIDLLNKIANGEKVPKRIKYENDIYVLVDNYCYYCDETNLILSDRIFAEYNRLNDKVEIIDEPKEIDRYKCQTSQIPPWFRNEELIRVINENFELHTKVISELIDEVNKLKENK